MKNKLTYSWLWFQAALHTIDAYLARHRGENAFAADCLSRAAECERHMATMRMNWRLQ